MRSPAAALGCHGPQLELGLLDGLGAPGHAARPIAPAPVQVEAAVGEPPATPVVIGAVGGVPLVVVTVPGREAHVVEGSQHVQVVAFGHVAHVQGVLLSLSINLGGKGERET